MKSLEQKLARKLNFKIYLIPNLLLITDLFLFLFHSSLKMIKFISLILREIIKKRLILLGQKKIKVLMQALKLSLNLLLECIRNLFLCLPVTFMVLLVILDQIVLCWGKNQNLILELSLGILMFLNLFLFVTFMVFLVTFVLTVIN